MHCKHYCKTLYFCCILISRFWNVEISLHFNLAFSQCYAIYQAFDGQTAYLILRFYPTCEISENLMHAKNMFYRSRDCDQIMPCNVLTSLITDAVPVVVVVRSVNCSSVFAEHSKLCSDWRSITLLRSLAPCGSRDL